MASSKKKLLLAFVITTAAGFGLHFLYHLLPNPVIALISPINESLWEHVKILFWPYLAAALILNHKGGEHRIRPWLLTSLLMVAAMLSIGYLYHIVLGGESMFFDIGLYLVLMVLGFLLPALFPGPWTGFLWELVVWITAALAVAIVLFTFWPPSGLLFTDLSGANTWSRITC